MSRPRIYLASSWRNEAQPEALAELRRAFYPVYDFRNPGDAWDRQKTGDDSGGFRWSDIDPSWETWSPWAFRQALETQAALLGFGRDWSAMQRSDVGVLLLPCGRSAHLEAGYFAGHPEKRLYIVAQELPEPELMYGMADGLFLSVAELLESEVLGA